MYAFRRLFALAITASVSLALGPQPAHGQEILLPIEIEPMKVRIRIGQTVSRPGSTTEMGRAEPGVEVVVAYFDVAGGFRYYLLQNSGHWINVGFTEPVEGETLVEKGTRPAKAWVKHTVAGSNVELRAGSTVTVLEYDASQEEYRTDHGWIREAYLTPTPPASRCEQYLLLDDSVRVLPNPGDPAQHTLYSDDRLEVGEETFRHQSRLYRALCRDHLVTGWIPADTKIMSVASYESMRAAQAKKEEEAREAAQRQAEAAQRQARIASRQRLTPTDSMPITAKDQLEDTPPAAPKIWPAKDIDAAVRRAPERAVKPETRYATVALNLRRGPSATHARILVIPARARVAMYECERDWCSLVYQNQQGWASARYLATSQPRSPTRSSSLTPSSPIDLDTAPCSTIRYKADQVYREIDRAPNETERKGAALAYLAITLARPECGPF